MDDQESELLEGYRRLRPESRDFIRSTVATALAAETTFKQQFGLVPENVPAQSSKEEVGNRRL
jgi:hypothetical protein